VRTRPPKPPGPIVPKTEGQRLLIATGASYTQIARGAGVEKTTVADWVHGIKTPNQGARKKLLATYKIPYMAWSTVPSVPGTGEPKDAPEPADESPTLPNSNANPPATVDEVDDLLVIVRGLRARANLTAQEILRIVQEERNLLGHRERIIERQELLENRLVREHPEWKRLRDLVLSALLKHPDAARDVARVLEGA
jgi:hypothetical protein